jgi:hypothetical protein
MQELPWCCKVSIMCSHEIEHRECGDTVSESEHPTSLFAT